MITGDLAQDNTYVIYDKKVALSQWMKKKNDLIINTLP